MDSFFPIVCSLMLFIGTKILIIPHSSLLSIYKQENGKYCSTPFVPTPSGIHSQFHLVLRQKWTVLETPP